MQDPEFEKIVRQKMEELNFSPPDSLWGKVELGIKNDKRTKRPLVWLFLFLGLGLASASYFIFTNKSNQINRQLVFPTLGSAPGIISEKKQEGSNGNQTILSKSADQDQAMPEHPQTFKPQKRVDPDFTSKLDREKQTGGDKMVGRDDGTQPTLQREINESNIQDQVKNPGPQPNAATENKSELISNSGKKNLPPQVRVDPLTQTVTPESNNQEAFAKKLPGSEIPDSSGLKQSVTAKKEAPRKKNPWVIGFTLVPGISSLDRAFLQSGASSDQVPAYSASGSSAGAGFFPPPSAIKAGFSISGGLFVEKKMSRRIFFTLGLNYHYYTTRIQIGEKVNGPVLPIFPAFYLSAPGPYYSNGNKSIYTNHFHFIELPVNVRMQLNKSIRLPISWEAGLSLCELVASDDLHYDPRTWIYFKDNALFNKTQIGASTAILLGFLHHGRSFQAGPDLQYGLTDLLKSNSGGGEHFLFYGIKLTMLTGKGGF